MLTKMKKGKRGKSVKRVKRVSKVPASAKFRQAQSSGKRKVPASAKFGLELKARSQGLNSRLELKA